MANWIIGIRHGQTAEEVRMKLGPAGHADVDLLHLDARHAKIDDAHVPRARVSHERARAVLGHRDRARLTREVRREHPLLRVLAEDLERMSPPRGHDEHLSALRGRESDRFDGRRNRGGALKGRRCVVGGAEHEDRLPVTQRDKELPILSEEQLRRATRQTRRGHRAPFDRVDGDNRQPILVRDVGQRAPVELCQRDRRAIARARGPGGRRKRDERLLRLLLLEERRRLFLDRRDGRGRRRLLGGFVALGAPEEGGDGEKRRE